MPADPRRRERLSRGWAGGRAVDGRFRARILLAKVMTQAKEDDTTAAAVRRPTRHRTPDLGKPSGPAAPRRAARARAGRARALRHPAGRAGDPGTARRDDPGGTGRAREGAAALHH